MRLTWCEAMDPARGTTVAAPSILPGEEQSFRDPKGRPFTLVVGRAEDLPAGATASALVGFPAGNRVGNFELRRSEAHAPGHVLPLSLPAPPPGYYWGVILDASELPSAGRSPEYGVSYGAGVRTTDPDGPVLRR